MLSYLMLNYLMLNYLMLSYLMLSYRPDHTMWAPVSPALNT